MLQRRTFEEILPLLVSTYKQGRLVPFLGAGMSAKSLALWDDFVENLEKEADIVSDDTQHLSNDLRAQAACAKIRNSRGRTCFLDSVGRSLLVGRSGAVITPQTRKLAEITWPLVVSTNYDDLYLSASRCHRSKDRSEPRSMAEMEVPPRCQ
jgi:hypothetical protein